MPKTQITTGTDILTVVASPETLQIRDAALAAAYGEQRFYHTPSTPNAAEACYLSAIDLFGRGRICLAYDLVEQADHSLPRA